MIASIATGSNSGNLGENLAAIATAGFDGIEIFENVSLAFDGVSSGRQSDGRSWRGAEMSKSATLRSVLALKLTSALRR